MLGHELQQEQAAKQKYVQLTQQKQTQVYALQKVMKELKDQNELLKKTRSELTKEMDNRLKEKESQMSEMKQELAKIKTNEEKHRSEMESLEQAIKAKNIMLDDQNETIRQLKQNLENKVRMCSVIVFLK